MKGNERNGTERKGKERKERNVKERKENERKGDIVFAAQIKKIYSGSTFFCV